MNNLQKNKSTVKTKSLGKCWQKCAWMKHSYLFWICTVLCKLCSERRYSCATSQTDSLMSKNILSSTLLSVHSLLSFLSCAFKGWNYRNRSEERKQEKTNKGMGTPMDMHIVKIIINIVRVSNSIRQNNKYL